ncbi:MAG: hypothetical protein CMK74_03935 [Pseudomonadales bacterium]|nr:hypothetical protein [Pseudomonadales bacterium]|tara:strand:+ start:229 stop:486 length:258 start_codon:yes stop_codon:yes gene_type:complete
MKFLKNTMEGIVFVVMGTCLPQLAIMTDKQATFAIIFALMALVLINWTKAQDQKVKPKPQKGVDLKNRKRRTPGGKRKRRRRRRR